MSFFCLVYVGIRLILVPSDVRSEIYLVGDITGDGKVTTIDFARAYMHAQHIESEDEYTKYELTGYAFACADVNGDGKVTTADAGMINSHVRGQSSLWQ